MTSEPAEDLSPQEDAIWLGVYVTEYIVIVTINAFTILAFTRKRHVRKRTTYLILNLISIVADLLVGAVTGPLGKYYEADIEREHDFVWREFIILTFVLHISICLSNKSFFNYFRTFTRNTLSLSALFN